MTPFDWQEGMGHRAQYVESRLAAGVPVVAVSTLDGVLAVTYRRQSRKLFEVYDRLMYAAIGQQADVESLRMITIDFAHREGYQRSEQDVTIRRVVAALSEPVKKAFGDFRASPLVVQALFAEVGADPERDRYYVLEYDGDYRLSRRSCALAGTEQAKQMLQSKLDELDTGSRPASEWVEPLAAVVRAALDPEGERNPAEVLAGLQVEAALLEREGITARRFRTLAGGDEL